LLKFTQIVNRKPGFKDRVFDSEFCIFLLLPQSQIEKADFTFLFSFSARNLILLSQCIIGKKTLTYTKTHGKYIFYMILLVLV
jgi:hypothetical protein